MIGLSKDWSAADTLNVQIVRKEGEVEMTHEEAVKWLELQSSIPIRWDNYSEESAQIRKEAERRIAEAFRMAINALKAQKSMKSNYEYQCNKCKFYEGVHYVQGHAPCSFWNIGGVMWNDYCSRFSQFTKKG